MGANDTTVEINDECSERKALRLVVKSVLPPLGQRLSSEDFLQDLRYVLNVHETDARLDALWNVLFYVGTVRLGRNDGLDACAVSGEDFLLQAADREHLSNKRYLASHG